MKQGFTLVGVGCLAGLILAVVAAKLLSGVLYGVGAFDTVAWTTALAVLAIASALANIVPALRAMRVDPVSALRTE